MLVKADLHIHSTHSDGKASPVEILHVAMERGLGVISITDHDTFSGSISASKSSSNYGVLVLPGVEVRTDKGDILLYCSKEIDFPRRIDLLIEKAHRENCLVVPAHPFDILRIGIGELVYEIRDWDAIEVWNASANKRANYKAVEAARITGKPGLANSDAHLPSEIGVAHTMLEVPDLKLEYVFEAILKNRVKPIFQSPSIRTRMSRLTWSIERIIRQSTDLLPALKGEAFSCKDR